MKTESNSTHTLAIITAFVALIAVAFGAMVISLKRPIGVTSAPPMNPAFEFWHAMIGVVAVVLALVLALKFSSKLGWLALGAALLDAALGINPIGAAIPELSGVLHALLAQIFFASVVAIAVMTSASWQRGPEPIEDTWRPSMRSLAIAVPAVILLQITLGACYRYQAMSVLWHIMNAMLVLLLALIVSVFLIRQFPEHATLKPAAVALAVIASIQVVLGFGTFLMLVMSPGTMAVLIITILHVTTGALTFGAGTALCVLMLYNARRAEVTHVSVTAS